MKGFHKQHSHRMKNPCPQYYSENKKTESCLSANPSVRLMRSFLMILVYSINSRFTGGLPNIIHHELCRIEYIYINLTQSS